jgi:hypothetical protein
MLVWRIFVFFGCPRRITLDAHEQLDEVSDEFEVVRTRGKRKRIDLKGLLCQIELQYRAAEMPCVRIEASADIEHKAVATILLSLRNEDVRENRFPRSSRSKYRNPK